MSVDLSLIIADLENKIAAADSNTPILDLLQMVTAAERLTGGSNVYDSAGLLPTGAQYEGTIAMTADGTLRYYQGQGWDTLDSNTYVTPYSFQGSVSGFLAGGILSSSNVIDTFSLVSDANATDVGDLTTTRGYTAGATSLTHGYSHGGGPSPTVMEDTIDKFPFSASANATDVGNLTANRGMSTGQSSSTYGYSAGGSPSGAPAANTNIIEKYPFSVDANSTDVGDLTEDRRAGAGTNSSDNGYMMGGWNGANSVTIDKFPFSSDANATDVGDTISGTGWAAGGQSSTTHGYVTGNVPNGNVIQKMPFSVDANTTDVGDLTVGRNYTTGVSSTTYGYAVGGSPSNVIDKFPFSTDANATDVGDLTVARGSGSGTQV